MNPGGITEWLAPGENDVHSNSWQSAFMALVFALALSQPVSGNPLPFDDEFDIPVNLLDNNTSGWSVLGSGGSNERATTIEIANGELTIVPEVFLHNGWFEDDYGPYVYQNVSGNFAVVIHLRVTRPDNPLLPPDLGFNAGGFVIRDASGTHSSDENWLMYNMGGQGQDGVTYAREMKKTVDSVSNLFLTEQLDLEEYLLACRVGNQFYFYYWADAIDDWRQETFYNQFSVDGVSTTTWRNSSSISPEVISAGAGQALPMHFEHAGMPETVQLGVMAHGWSNSENGVRGDFDFVRFGAEPPQSQGDCTSQFDFSASQQIFISGFEAPGS